MEIRWFKAAKTNQGQCAAIAHYHTIAMQSTNVPDGNCVLELQVRNRTFPLIIYQENTNLPTH